MLVFLAAGLAGANGAQGAERRERTPLRPVANHEAVTNTPAEPHVVQNVSGYNSWPMMQAIGDKLVCVYSRGGGHTIGEDARAVYARTSSDGGKSWTLETVVADSPGYGEVAVGKGLDASGAMLLWVRRVGRDRHHDLYRTTDGIKFTLLARPKLSVMPMQITDVFAVPKVGPSLILDPSTGLLSNYYYHRGKGLLRRRVVDPERIFIHPLHWPASEIVATGSQSTFDAGNVNATVIGETHYVSFYSGKAPDTAVLVSALPAPAASVNAGASSRERSESISK